MIDDDEPRQDVDPALMNRATLPADPDDFKAVDIFHEFCEEHDIYWECERGFIAVMTQWGLESLYPGGVLEVDQHGRVFVAEEGDPALAA